MPLLPAACCCKRIPGPLGILTLLLLLCCTALPAWAEAERTISDYRVIARPVRDGAGEPRLAIRSFRAEGVEHLLVVDPVSLQTADLPAAAVSSLPGSAAAHFEHSPLFRALGRFDGPPYPLQNGGARRAENGAPGQFLTVDLCPSRRPFERELFETAKATGKGGPVPVAVAITGLWLQSHPEELAYLKGEAAAGRLAITWVNHSFHHPYDSKAPLERTFLLTTGIDFRAEVLDLERLLLARGLVPSPFFRFPGLVSDAATVKTLRELSLIPIGADAWLAKGETPRPGSFILVHGNGNEPKGIKLILPLLRGGELHLLPLTQAFR